MLTAIGRFRFTKTFLLLFWAVALLVMGPRVGGQTNYGSIVGTVTDSSGAVVPGVQVTLKNNGTNATENSTSESGGTYRFVNLNPGSYSVTVTQAGFDSLTKENIDVQIGGTVRVDVSLNVGNISQNVSVNATTSDLHTDSATLDGVIEGRQVLDAPLNGRNVNNLLDFVPGVTPGGGTQGSTVANGGSGNFQAGGQTQAIAYGNYQIGGGFSGQSLFYLDGMGQNVPENNVNALVPTQDAVQEFRVSTNNISAEFGGFGGGVIQISTKSGTNDFHGSAYEYFRNTALDANDWFSNHQNLGKSPLHQNQYGANLGGPIFKNKAFFFFSWEHQSLISTAPTSIIAPTTAELAGNFAGEQTIYDPTTGLPFQGNIIQPNRIDPVALKILTLETPNENRVAQTPLIANANASAPIEGYQTQFNARVDYTLSKADSLFVRYTFWNPHNGPSDPFGTQTGAGTTGNTTQEAVIGDTHVFNPTTIADLRVSYLENYNFQNPLSKGFNMSTIGPNYGTVQANSEGQEGLLPGLGIQGYGIGAELSQLYWNNTVSAINGSVTKILGRHTVKAGGSLRSALWTSYGNSSGLTINATPSFTAQPVTGVGGNALASFLLGIPTSTSISSITTQHAFLHTYAFYGTDAFQATPKLTLTAGLRGEQPGAYSEKNDLNTVLLPNAAATVGNITSITNPVTGSAEPLTGQLALVNSPQYSSRREEQLHWKLFSPRVGFAYRIDDKTVVRSGYGLSYLPAEYTQDGPQLSPIARAATDVSNTVGQPLLATVANPLPNGINPPLGRTQAALNDQIGNGLWARVPDQKYGYAQQWNLAFERALTSKSTASLAYAGAKGTHLIGASAYTASGLNINQLPDGYDSLGSGLLTQVANPFFGQVPAGTPISGATVAEGYLLLPHPQYPNGVLQQVPRFGISNYNALQASYTRRFNHEGIVQVAYTWSKLMSNVDNTSAFQDGQGGTAVVQDNDNLQAEYSLSEQDLANNLVINYGINLPFGHGESYLSHSNGITNAILGGWRVNGITILKSGLPLALVAAPNQLSVFGGGTQGFGISPQQGIIRPSVVPGVSKTLSGGPHSNARAATWFNVNAFVQPPNPYSFGNEQRVDSTLKSEGEDNFDTSFMKSFDITERVKLRFDGEIFDIFNHAQFAEPNLSVASPGSFGQVTHQLNLPRTAQLALRLAF